MAQRVVSLRDGRVAWRVRTPKGDTTYLRDQREADAISALLTMSSETHPDKIWAGHCRHNSESRSRQFCLSLLCITSQTESQKDKTWSFPFKELHIAWRKSGSNWIAAWVINTGQMDLHPLFKKRLRGVSQLDTRGSMLHMKAIYKHHTEVPLKEVSGPLEILGPRYAVNVAPVSPKPQKRNPWDSIHPFLTNLSF